MIELDALKKSWKNQKPAADTKFDLDKITGESLSKLKKFEKKQFNINLAKTTGIALIFIYLVWSMLFMTSFSAIKAVAVIWILLSILVFLVIYWRVQLKVNKLNVNDNSLGFIDDVLENFSQQKKLFREKFWMFGVALTIGINILYLDLLKDVPLMPRIGLHAGVCVLMFAVIWGGIKFRMRRFRREYEPVVNELLKIKEDLSN